MLWVWSVVSQWFGKERFSTEKHSVYAWLLSDLDRNYFRFSWAKVTVIFTRSWLILIDCPELREQPVVVKMVNEGRDRPLSLLSLSKLAIMIRMA